MVRIAHISDFHLAQPLRLGQVNCKRFLGYLNWMLFRRRKHLRSTLTTTLAAVLAAKPDVVVCTGDLGQLGASEDWRLAEEFLSNLTASSIPILLLKGNHDCYGSSEEDAAFFTALQQRLRLGLEVSDSGLCRLEDVTLLLLNQAVASRPFQAYGQQDVLQLDQLKQALLASPPKSPPIGAGHFPFVLPGGFKVPTSYGLRNAPALLRFLTEIGCETYLCGHIHKAFIRPLTPPCTQYCATSASIASTFRLFTVGAGKFAFQTFDA